MNPIFLILFGIFVNFFGWYIINEYVKFFGMYSTEIIFNKTYWASSILDTGILYAVIFIIGCFLTSKLKKNIKNYPSKNEYKFYRGYAYIFITMLIVGGIAFNILNFNFSGSLDNRGVDQFNRDITSALSRMYLLFVPILTFYRLSFKDGLSIKIYWLFLITVLISSLLSGDRRIIFYFAFSYLVIKFYENTHVTFNYKVFIKKISILFFSFLFFIFLYVRRAGDIESELAQIGFLIIYPVLGALGISAILPEVKSLIVNSTGYLYGRSFLMYIFSLIFPSFILYFFGEDEFYFRSSLYFNELFNDNPNMGYDFMMIADFYWNFGYLGYLLYIIMVFFIFNFLISRKVLNNPKYQGVAAMLVVFFVASQRSDFGLFLKSFIYTSILYLMLYYFFPKRKVN